MNESTKRVVERAGILKDLVYLVPQDEEGVKLHPILADILTPRYRDGKPTKQGGICSLRVEGSLYRVSVVCPTEQLQTVYQTDTFKDILKKLETFLASGKANWSPTFESIKRARQVIDEVIT